jgi:7,8-dihydropterin-6-yl-methyl-4-(beta-D-ribofuranosyl)aminobenzene 5'-phosphate synthase
MSSLFTGGAGSRGWRLLPFLIAVLATASAQPNRVTILTDAFTKKEDLESDWGYSALIEYEGRRILFDAGDDAAVFRRNTERMHVDLSHLDFVIVSHAHGDHTAALRYVLALNPKVRWFAPDDDVFRGREVPRPFLTTNPDPSLPPEKRYYRGQPPEHIPSWRSWNDTQLTIVKEPTVIAPGLRLVAAVSDNAAFKGLPEISLVLDTPKGRVVVVGCSHPGIERILVAATADDPEKPVHLLLGGLHLLQDSPEEIAGTLNLLVHRFRIEKMAVGHCTGERAFSMIHQLWGENEIYAGLGEVISLDL